MVVLGLYVILVVLDILFTIQLLLPRGNSSIFNEIGSLFFILFSPFVSIISPLLGAAALLSCKINLYQISADFNTVCIFTNCLSQLIMIFVYNPNDVYSIVVGIILIVVKLLLAQLIPILNSYFHNRKYFKNISFLEQHYNNDSPNTPSKASMRKTKATKNGKVAGSRSKSKQNSPYEKETMKRMDLTFDSNAYEYEHESNATVNH